MIFHLSPVAFAAIVIWGLYLHVELGRARWQACCAADPEGQTNELILHAGMTEWPWHRRWVALGFKAVFVAFWPAWLLLGFVLASWGRIRP